MTVPGGLTKEWLTPEDAVSLGSPDLPSTVQAFNRLAVANGWRSDERRARKCTRGWEYHLSVLPASVQMRWALRNRAEAEASPAGGNDVAFAVFDALPASAKAEAQRRLAAVRLVDKFTATMTARAAIQSASQALSVPERTLRRWWESLSGVPAADWLPALAPGYKPRTTFAACHPRALQLLTSDWLRPERPAFSACYRRMRKAASANGWLPIPSERALRRRVEAEVPRAVATLVREGRDKAKTLYPAQKRSRAMFHAMQAVTMDGHKFDVRVSAPWADGPIRPLLIAIQDLYSGMIIAWRLVASENRHAVRLTIGDMVEKYGIPELMVFDNGRAFASKDITGGAKNRFRGKIRDDDPRGLLTTLGVKTVFTLPYSGQSKPIERAFRDLCEDIAKHPACAGAYTGNSPANKPENYGTRTVPLEAFRQLVANQIEEHNARPGRKTETAAGRSFLETFNESYAVSTIEKAGPSKRALWLLTADRITAQRGSGEIHMFGNRYWSVELNDHAGKKVTVRFDPDKLHEPVRVYDAKDRLICEARCIAPVGFSDTEQAQAHGRDRAAYERTLREHERLRERLTADQLAEIYGAAPSVKPTKTPRSKVVRLAGTRAAAAAAAQPEEDNDFDFQEALERGLRLVASRDD